MLRVMTFLTSWLNWAPERLWNALKSRPFIHRQYEPVDVGMDTFEYFLDSYDINIDVEKTLCKTGRKNFLTLLYMRRFFRLEPPNLDYDL